MLVIGREVFNRLGWQEFLHFPARDGEVITDSWRKVLERYDPDIVIHPHDLTPWRLNNLRRRILRVAVGAAHGASGVVPERWRLSSDLFSIESVYECGDEESASERPGLV
jgi:hypothetical protein